MTAALASHTGVAGVAGSMTVMSPVGAMDIVARALVEGMVWRADVSASGAMVATVVSVYVYEPGAYANDQAPLRCGVGDATVVGGAVGVTAGVLGCDGVAGCDAGCGAVDGSGMGDDDAQAELARMAMMDIALRTRVSMRDVFMFDLRRGATGL